jgi:hypothetical protein
MLMIVLLYTYVHIRDVEGLGGRKRRERAQMTRLAQDASFVP